MKAKKIYYQAIGQIRGSCGHLHRSYAAAERCCEKDRKLQASKPGRCYSDRVVLAVDNKGNIDNSLHSNEKGERA